jgi:thiamine-phosphate pyrophosphorylase
MLEDISPAVERALDAARKKGADGQIDAVHLLLALIEDEESRAARVLIEHGGDLDVVRRLLQTHPGFAFDAPAVIRGAREIAGERTESTITGEFLLLGLIHSSSQLHKALQQAGVSVERITKPNELPVLEVAHTLEIRDTADFVSAGRAVDANANRAREALRVIDDYCRFVLGDGVLTAEAKALRHELSELLALIPVHLLHESRDTLGDVGLDTKTAGEFARGATADVASINCKRLQESLRSLEEFGKVVVPEIVHGVESIRYRAYTLERAITIGLDARNTLARAKLHVLLTGSQCHASLDWTIAEAAAGGATIFQLREKGLTDRELLERARNVRLWTRKAGALFIVNDRPDIARLVEADGVHLGQDDMSVAEARKILGPTLLIGVSTHNVEQVQKAVTDGASYIGIGPTFASETKKFEQLAGLEFVNEATAMTALPAFAIGGINANNVAEVINAGAKCVAVSAAICQADEPQAMAARIIGALNS